jgi:hypothetical protein
MKGWVLIAACACGSESKSVAAVDSQPEVAAMFAELQVREEQYKVDSGSYLAAPTCSDPPTCAAWKTLNVKPPIPKLTCSYAITAGTGGTATPPSGFTMATPKGNWNFLVATCPEATFFASSVDAAIQRTAR